MLVFPIIKLAETLLIIQDSYNHTWEVVPAKLLDELEANFTNSNTTFIGYCVYLIMGTIYTLEYARNIWIFLYICEIVWICLRIS